MKKKNPLALRQGNRKFINPQLFSQVLGLIPIRDNFNMDPHCLFGTIFAFLPIFILTKQQSQLQRTFAAHQEPKAAVLFVATTCSAPFW